MIRKFLLVSAAALCVAAVLMGCGDSGNPNSPQTDPLIAPTGATKIYADGFETDLSKWDDRYMVIVGDYYTHMQITSASFKDGKNSLTADSNRTALLYSLSDENSVSSGIVGVSFYIMAKEKGGINFTVEIGKNAGSSGGLGKAFGIGFDPNDSIKCKYFFDLANPPADPIQDSMIAPIDLNHWYKCNVEADFALKKVRYTIDDKVVRTMDMPSADMSKIDRLLVFRGERADRPGYGMMPCKAGTKQYYVDDIVFYKK